MWIIFPWNTLELKEQNWNFLVAVGNAVQYLITGVDSICWNWLGGVHREVLILQINYAILLPSSSEKLIFSSSQLQSVFMWCGVIVLLNALQFPPVACRKSENSFVWHWKPWPVSRYNSSRPVPQPTKLPASLPDYNWGRPVRLYFNPPHWNLFF